MFRVPSYHLLHLEVITSCQSYPAPHRPLPRLGHLQVICYDVSSRRSVSDCRQTEIVQCRQEMQAFRITCELSSDLNFIVVGDGVFHSWRSSLEHYKQGACYSVALPAAEQCLYREHYYKRYFESVHFISHVSALISSNLLWRNSCVLCTYSIKLI